MEGGVFHLVWEKQGKGLVARLPGDPRFVANDSTPARLRKALRKLAISLYGDHEPLFDFWPFLPDEAKQLDSFEPDWVILQSYGTVEATTRSGGALTEPGCVRCGESLGERRRVKLLVMDRPGVNDCITLVTDDATRCAFSREFLSLLTPEEQRHLQGREVEFVSRTKRRFFELMAKRLVPFTASRLHGSRWEQCPDCRRSRLETELKHTDCISRSQLPIGVSLFLAGTPRVTVLCMKGERWVEIRRDRTKVRNIFALPVQVIRSDWDKTPSGPWHEHD